MIVTLTVRLPDILHEQLVREAAANHRSLNAQIVWLLEQARKEKGES